ncbi:phage baseplate assembly protein V [bacterium]|nr:phage baseplate assembly protein V [bacterium]
MSDNLNVVWSKFFNHRTKTLWERFPGYYRSLVIETSDPLNMYRVKFKCPELHDFDLPPEDCPWAVPCFDLGGNKAGRFVAPTIGDWVWITFEKQHPYGPIWTGFANPTRRKFYTYPQIFQKTPLAVNTEGIPTERPDDYDEDYLPKDGRPMGHGWQDRYGNLDVHSAVGYFPSEHVKAPPPPEHDALAGQAFEQQVTNPQVNDPDRKYMARVTKYGHIFLMGDQGYHWKKGANELGEFEGDVEEDEQFEKKRWLFLQRLLNDNVPKASDKNGDQRKQLMMTRYGHRIEMRDVGWAQYGPMESKSRAGEFGPARHLSKERKSDYRWIKIRTKGGMLFQAYDKGFDPSQDKYIKRHLLEESGAKSEQEDKYWGDRDARWMRMVTRYGIKLVLDDRGSDLVDARKREVPRGVGVLFKGRRTPAAKEQERRGNPRGFQFEFNERDDANHMTMASPLGQTIELNDRYQYMMLTAALGKSWVPKWRGVKDNEFIAKPTMMNNPEKNTHHLKLDHDNEYVRLKTRGNKGTKPRNGVNPSGVGKKEINQGFEARDGRNGDGPWVELVDCQQRGFWFSKSEGIGIWRARKKRKMYQWMDEKQKKIVIYNNEKQGTIEIYSTKSVNVISDRDVNIRADRHITMRAGKSIRMQAAGTRMTLRPNILQVSARIRARQFRGFFPGLFPGPGARNGVAPQGERVERLKKPKLPKKRSPRDRAKTYNKPFKAAKKIK